MSGSPSKSVRPWKKFFVLLIMCVCLTHTVVITAGAAQARQSANGFEVDRSVTGEAPVFVFQGERVNISQVDGTTGSLPSDRAGLVGISGNADGTFYQDSSRHFDFDRVEDGRYDFDRDRNADIIVRQPEIEHVRLYRGSPATGINVTNGRIALSQDDLYIQVEFNFEVSNEDVKVSVINPDGLDITRELSTDVTASENNDVIRLSNLSSLERGQFRVRVSGTGAFESATRTVMFTRGREPLDIFLESNSVTQGAIVNGTVRGNAGERVQVRIPHSATENGVTTDQVFEPSDNILYLTDQPPLEGQQYHTAVIGIGSSGEETIQINTRRLKVNQVVGISTAEGTNLENPAVSDAYVEITSPDITIESAPDVVVLGNQFRISGQGPENGIIRAYVKHEDSYVPLEDVSGNPIEIDTRPDGTYNITASTTEQIRTSGVYDIIITGNDQNDGNTVLSSDEYQNIDLRAVTPIRAQESSLTATLSTDWIATNAGDNATISGYTTESSIKIYIVSSRGVVLKPSGTPVQRLNGVETTTPTDGAFTEQMPVLNSSGEYQIIVISAPDSNNWHAIDNNELSNLDNNEVVEFIQNQYADNDSQFSTVTLSLQANASQLTVEVPRDGEQVSPENITVGGQSNREDGQDIFIEILDQNQSVLMTEARVDGRNNTWHTTLNASTLSPGNYTVRADDGITTTSTTFEVMELSSGFETVVTDSTVIGAEPTTGASGPGFTLVSLALAFVAFIAVIIIISDTIE